MGTVTKKHLIERIADKSQLNRDQVRDVLHQFLQHLIEELAEGNRIEFRDFGVFEVRQRAARTAQNPKTLAPVTVPARRTVKFKVGRLMKERLDTPPGDEPPQDNGVRIHINPRSPRGARA
jgi:integration host factor subunit beta